MHLWPSTRLRDSFKQGYLKNLEWNLHRMEKSEKKQSSENSTGKKLLDKADEEGDSTGCAGSGLVFCRDLLMILSCCYCCGGLSSFLLWFYWLYLFAFPIFSLCCVSSGQSLC